MEIRESFIDGPGGRLFIQDCSPVPDADLAPILLFHDSLGCVALWRGFPIALASATGHRVIAYDRLGFGQSQAHRGHLELDFIADEAISTVPLLLDALSLNTFMACGHSVGGGMAVETAARFPECSALITMGAQAYVDEKVAAGVREAQTAFADETAIARLEKYHGKKARWVVDAWTQSWLHPAFASWTLDDAIQRIRCPVLAIHGENDEYASAQHPMRIAASHGHVEILPGVGHIPHREAETIVVERIRRFLKP